MGDLADFLALRGVTPDEIAQAQADHTLELMVVELMFKGGPPKWTLEELAVQAGLSMEQMGEIWRAMGFPDPEPGAVIADEEDLAAIQRASERLKPDSYDHTLQLLRITSSSLARVAESSADDAGALLGQAQAAGVDAWDRAEAILKTFDIDEVTATVAYLYRLQLLTALRRRFADDHVTGIERKLAVGFVDLVDFTVVSQELEPDELASMVAEFEARAYATVAEEGARVVKTIGDEVMFSTESPAAAVSIGLRLAGDNRRGPLTPDVRAGIAYGPVVTRFGDAFGPVVNLASRAVNVANPGTVLVAEEVHEALADDAAFRWRELRPHRLKGIGWVRLWRVSHPRGAEDPDDDRRSRRGGAGGRDSTDHDHDATDPGRDATDPDHDAGDSGSHDADPGAGRTEDVRHVLRSRRP